MNVLRSFLVSLATSPNKEKEHSVTILSSVKQDLVSTLRKVIDIITCYANNALPSQAKATVRGTILSLPSRWAYMYDSTTTVDQADNIELQQQISKEVRIAPYKQEDVALRLLTFGQESSNMLTSIHNVFEDTIQRAENWLEKLRMINPMSSSNETYSKKLLPLPNIDNNGTSSYFRNNNHNPRTPIKKDSEDEEDFCDVLLPPILNLHISSSPISNPSSN
ncbi:MAG: transcription factor Opi1-domain-containing protein [Benjaminiella poitrasii]|nr:MAG: transcription factor Opi1-domain-containing protein [Benjaminiella poitrasii]